MSLEKHLDKTTIAKLKKDGLSTKSTIEVVEIPLELVKPNEWNPNVQSEDTFNELVQDIQKDGFDEPIQVVVVKKEDESFDHFRIIGGEHRYHALKLMKAKTIPVVIKDYGSEDEQKIKTVRRNVLTGELDAKKFTKLFDQVMKSTGDDTNELIRKFGILKKGQFNKAYIENRGDRDEEIAKKVLESKMELKVMKNLSFVLNQLFSEFGETVMQNFMFLFYGKRIHLMMQINNATQKSLTSITNYCKDHKVDVSEILERLMDGWHKKIDLPVNPKNDYFKKDGVNRFE